MNLLSRIPRWLAAAAVTCAAIGVPSAALALPGHPAAPAVAAAPSCASADLTVWLGVPGQGAAGSVFYELEFSNVSNHICTLFGYPGVSAVAAGGGQLGSPAARSTLDPKKLVTLNPGGTAHAFLRIVDVSAFPASACQPAKAIGLKVFPANTSSAAIVDFPFQACALKGPKFLTVTTTVTHTGIPGFNH
jgi:hypothetical protein